MTTSKDKSDRRNFIKACALGGSVLGAPVLSAIAKNIPGSRIIDSVLSKPLLLNFNENSLGMSSSASEAAQKATREQGNRYPDDMVETLRQILADKHGVNSRQIIFGNGSTEVIQAVVTLAAERKATIVEPLPTFGDVRRYANAEGLKIIQVPVRSTFETDLQSIKLRCTKIDGPVLINLCNPNNPTGTILDKEKLRHWIRDAPERFMFLVDEAYYEYASPNPAYDSALPLIKNGKDNLIITRTFSKLYGMAGMRIGYGIASPKTAAEVRAFAAGYNLSAPGLAAAIASIADTDFQRKSLESNQKAKQILVSTLDELKLPYIESDTNFVLHRIAGPLSTYASRMLQKGIKVGRRMTPEDGWNRLSLGTPEEMRIFSSVLREFRSKGWV